MSAMTPATAMGQANILPTYNKDAPVTCDSQTKNTIALQYGAKVDVLELELSPETEDELSILYSLSTEWTWSGSPSEITIKSTPDKFLHGYQNGVSVYVNKTHVMTLRVCPWRSTMAFAKLRLHVAEIDRLHLWPLVSSLLKFHATQPSWLKQFMETGRLSYLELAYDMPHIFSHFFWYRAMSKKSHIIGNQGNETIYLNRPRSPLQICVYNKKIQLFTKKEVAVSNDHVTRLEVRLKRSKLGCTLNEASTHLNNSLQGVRPYIKKKVAGLDYDLFTEAVEIGMHNALVDYTPQERKNLVKKLDACAIPDWWKAEQIWKEMVAATAALKY